MKLEYESLVYFILQRKYNAVKIGFTTDIDQRISAIRTFCPMHNDIKLLFWFDGSQEEEREFHRRFRSYRLDGEWFSLEGELKDFVDECILTTKKQVPRKSSLWQD